MSKEQVFLDAIEKCEDSQLTTSFIGKVAGEDKTKTLKKYMNSYGVFQLATYLQELGRTLQPPKELIIALQNGSQPAKKPAGTGVAAAISGILSTPSKVYVRPSDPEGYGWGASLGETASRITPSYVYESPNSAKRGPSTSARARAKAKSEAKLKAAHLARLADRNRSSSSKDEKTATGPVTDDGIMNTAVYITEDVEDRY